MSSKRRREPTFAEIVERTPKTGAHPRDGQNQNRVDDRGGWDKEGRYWERNRSGGWLSRDAVEHHLANGALLHCHSYGGLSSTWCSNAEGRALWREVLSDRFIEDNRVSTFDEAGWPEQAVHSATLCTRPDGQRLLWFEEHC